MTALMRHFKAILSDQKAFAAASVDAKEIVRRADEAAVLAKKTATVSYSKKSGQFVSISPPQK